MLILTDTSTGKQYQMGQCFRPIKKGELYIVVDTDNTPLIVESEYDLPEEWGSFVLIPMNNQP